MTKKEGLQYVTNMVAAELEKAFASERIRGPLMDGSDAKRIVTFRVYEEGTPSWPSSLAVYIVPCDEGVSLQTRIQGVNIDASIRVPTSPKGDKRTYAFLDMVFPLFKAHLDDEVPVG